MPTSSSSARLVARIMQRGRRRTHLKAARRAVAYLKEGRKYCQLGAFLKFARARLSTTDRRDLNHSECRLTLSGCARRRASCSPACCLTRRSAAFCGALTASTLAASTLTASTLTASTLTASTLAASTLTTTLPTATLAASTLAASTLTTTLPTATLAASTLTTTLPTSTLATSRCYTALPLHFVDSDWPLWQLAALFTLCYLPRVIMTEVFARAGDWLCVPVSAVALASNILMRSYPDNLVHHTGLEPERAGVTRDHSPHATAPQCLQAGLLLTHTVEPRLGQAVVCFATCATCTSLCPTVLRSLVYQRFAHSGEWQRQRALRIFTLSDTFGYATAPFIGGVLYDHGGLRACAGFALTTSALGVVLPLGLTVYRRSLPRPCRLWEHGESASSGDRGAMDGQQGDASGGQLSGAKVVEQRRTSRDAGKAIEGDASGGDDCGGITAEAPPEQAAGAHAALLLAPTATIMAGVFANICTYAVEWCLYAIYFRLEYNWSGSWTGFAQMIGDLLGGTVLGLSTMACVTERVSRVALPRAARALLQPPLGVATLLCCHAALMVMLAQPHFAVALTGQILMGTAYVFCEQLLQEMLLVYSFGDHRLYRRLVSLHYVFFTAGCSLCAPIAYGLYEVSGFAGAFYATAGCAGSAGIAFAAYFTCRLAPTSNEMLASLREAERELRDAKARRTVELRAGGGRTAASDGASAVPMASEILGTNSGTNSKAAGSP